MPYTRGQRYEVTETLNIDPTATALLPLGGFIQGDMIKLTGDTQGREIAGLAETVRGFVIDDVIFPYTKKLLEIATKGEVEVTVDGAFPVGTIMIIATSNFRRLTGATLNASGTIYRQALGRLLTSTAAAGDKAILEINLEMITI